ncbi:MAG: signal recognition particle-docking protein FtsY [Mycoplasmataceae bacterium]|nr:signal recognition particle-docking protein FtsY [Mycoplasmataceae bacterium]
MAILRKKQKQDEVLEVIKQTRVESNYQKGLKKAKNSFTKKIRLLASKHLKLDEKYFLDLENELIMADLGVTFTSNLIKKVKTEAQIKKITDPNKLTSVIFRLMFEGYFNKKEQKNSLIKYNPAGLTVILVIGVNGVGKTTSIGKLAKIILQEQKTIALVAGDTFRAGAVKQLEIWAKKINIPIITPQKQNQDPASVVYRGLDYALENNIDVLIIDTAGRLQNKVNLMAELKKIDKIIEDKTKKPIAETLLVLDATTGQNGILQAKAFDEVTKLTGIILTKMDSSSKGGIILPIKDVFNIPVKFIGLGETLDDLEPFDLKQYLANLLGEKND